MKLLSVVRLSDLTDETTSPARQRAAIERYAKAHGHTIVAVAEDLDVSGAVEPVKRPSLGPWLTDPHLVPQYDCLIVARLDRLTRSILDFETLWQWLDARGKSLICLDPSLDFTSDTGRMVAQILIIFAAWERRVISARIKDSYHSLRKQGYYAGGTYSFGYVPVKQAGHGWRLEPDEYAATFREIVRRYLAGDSLATIAAWLNETSVPTSRDIQRQRSGLGLKGYKWAPDTILKMFKSPGMLGQYGSASGPVRDEDGLILHVAEPLISAETYALLTEAIAARANFKGPQLNVSLLLNVAFCALCGAPLYQAMATGTRRYYHCRDANKGNCEGRKIRQPFLDTAAEDAFIGMVGDTEIFERITIKAEDNSAELGRVTEALAALEDSYVNGDQALSAERYLATAARLEERRDRLAALPSLPQRYEYRPSGQTFAQRWQGSDTNERRRVMRESGFEIRAARRPDDSYVLAFRLDEDLARRAGMAASGEPVKIPGHEAVQASWLAAGADLDVSHLLRDAEKPGKPG